MPEVEQFMLMSAFSKAVFESPILDGGLEFLSHKIELWNRGMQNNVTFQVTNSKIFIEILIY